MTRTAVPSIDAAGLADLPSRTTDKAETFAVRLRRIASEPFVHFTLLGALAFAGHRLLTRADARTLEISASKQRELAKLFEQRQHRPPEGAERQQLIQRYVEDEILFREGLRLSLVNTDPMLRAQLIARMRGMLQAEFDEKPSTDADLARYYEAHRSDYVVPEPGAASGPTLSSIRGQVSADYRKDRTAHAFRAALDRMRSEWRVQVVEQP